MNTIYSVAASAALVVFSVSAGQAASNPADNNSPAVQARSMIEQIDARSADIASAADQLQTLGLRSEDLSASQIDDLNAIKEDVNNIGGELRTLEAEQGSLTPWESKAVADVLPLMQDIATNADQAIRIMNSDRNHVWATPFSTETARIYADAVRVKGMLDGQLKLASVREEEQTLVSKVEANR